MPAPGNFFLTLSPLSLTSSHVLRASSLQPLFSSHLFNLDTSPPVSGPPAGTKSPFFYYVGQGAFKLEHELESESPGGLAKTQIPGNPPQDS